MTLTWKLMRHALCAAALVVISADLAAAAPARTASNTNLRGGPGTDQPILSTVPGGSLVNIVSCSGEWCNVTWRGRAGYMISRNLSRGTAARVVRPAVVARPVVVVEPAPVVVYGGPRVYIGGPRYYWRRW